MEGNIIHSFRDICIILKPVVLFITKEKIIRERREKTICI